MPSNIQSFPVHLDNGNGTVSPVPNQLCKIWDVVGAAELTTATTDANGIFPTTNVSLAPGSLVRIRIENREGRAGYIEAVTV